MRIHHLDEGVGRIVKGVNTTPDVGVDQTRIEAAKFGNKVDKDGRPPTLSKKVKGNSTNVLFNLGLTEGIKLRLERDKHIDVLHIQDTKEKHRVEVRGKKGYESGNYDPKDKLHQVLDRVGKAANISELMNGEVVSINPNHPQGTRAIRTAKDVLQTEDAPRYTALEWACIEGGHNLGDLQMLFNDLRNFKKLKEALGELSPSTEIYVDMDGVLADFFGEWAKLMNVDHFTQINKKHDIDDALQKIRDTEEFWLNLPLLPQARQLLSLIKKVKGSYNICSSPLANDPKSEPHKREWIKRNLDFFPPKNIYITHNKPNYAKNLDGTPNILIDDYGVNINAWEDAGGIGFKYKDHKFERTASAIKQAMQENFADGKKKGKSRPGRVKRSGASCKGSVTDLRKRAKKYSGERGRMYHWCANMKGGKKK